MRPRALLPFALAALVGAAVAVLPAFAAAPAEVKLEVNENCVDPDWPCWTSPGGSPKPAFQTTIAPGGVVTFSDDSTAANIAWAGTPPTCEPSVPVSPTPAKTGWEGKCTFATAGTYKFESAAMFKGLGLDYTKYEVVVESASIGTSPTTTTTATPTTTTTTTSTPTSEPSYGSPAEGSSSALKLARSQHGASVHGSIAVPQADAAGRLEIGLYAVGASLAKAGKPVKVRVGRLVRSSLAGNSVSFSVPLNGKGKAALRRHRHLGLTVKVTLTPVHGAAVTVTRTVVLHA
jgi:hypothetical protein